MCLAVPGRVVQIQPGDALLRTGKVDFGGILKDVNLACVPEAALGDYVLVHVGTAIGLIDAAEAASCLEHIRQL